MDKKGFTLIELLAVIVLLGILSSIAIPSIIGVVKNQKEKTYESKINSLESAAKLYLQDYKEEYYNNDLNYFKVINNKTYVTLKLLKEKGYIDNTDDPTGKNKINNNTKIEVKITNVNGRHIYYATLSKS